MDRSYGEFSCIAVDMGASSIRIILGTLQPDQVTLEEVHRIPNGPVYLEGHERWEMERILREIAVGIGMAWDRSGGTARSVGIDSWGVDFMLLDEDGEPVEMPVAYRDQRTEGMQLKWREEMTEVETFNRTGINFYPFNTLFQILSMRGSGILARSTSLLFLPCYVNYLLTGKAFNELTISSTSQMLRAEGQQWDPEILGRLGLREELLGPVIDPGKRLGELIWPGLARTRMEGVAVCGHDTACVVASIPAKQPDYVYISAGTWCIVGIESDRPLLSEAAFRGGWTNERGYGNVYRVVKNIVGLWLIQGLRKQMPEGTSYGEMERMAKGGEESVLIDPEDPLFYNPPDMRAAFDAFFRKTDQEIPGSMDGYIRSAYRSLCFSFRYHIEQLEKLSGKRLSVIHLVGGGSQSGYLNQHIATICEREVISGPVEGAATGNILVQAISNGVVRNLHAGRELVARSCSPGHFLPAAGRMRISQQYNTFLKYKQNNEYIEQ